MQTALIGIDWGTSRLRGFRIGSDGQLLERRESSSGIAAVRDGGFDQALKTLITDWLPDPGSVPILMCGMVGSRQGWREVPYRPCPAAFADLVAALAPIDTGCGPAFIVGGLSTINTAGLHDIMRGEETQILGSAPTAGRHLVIAPGTHSKWAVVEQGRVESFQTYLTGEVYDLLCEHSSLGWLMQAGTDGDEDEPSFLSGVRRSFADPRLLHMLFGVRTTGLFENRPPAALSSYLSGLLIGSELSGELQRHPEWPVIVIGSPALVRLYGIALSEAGRSDFQHIDGDDAVVRGLWRLWQLHRNEADR